MSLPNKNQTVLENAVIHQKVFGEKSGSSLQMIFFGHLGFLPGLEGSQRLG